MSKSETSEKLLENIKLISLHSRRIFYTYGSFLIYGLITALTITNKQIFLSKLELISLPLIGVKVSLEGFFLMFPVIIACLYTHFIINLFERKKLVDSLEDKTHIFPWSLLNSLENGDKRFFVPKIIAESCIWLSFPLFIILLNLKYIQKHNAPISAFLALILLFVCFLSELFPKSFIQLVIGQITAKAYLWCPQCFFYV